MSNVDVLSRRRYAGYLRSLATGRITNFEYEDAVNEFVDFGKDDVLRVMYRYAWNLYDDLHKHRLVGEYALPKEARREIAKWIVFLYTDLEYRWPTLWQRLSSRVFRITGCKYGKPLKEEGGDEEVWPFFSKQEFNAVVSRPVSFVGPSGLGAERKTRTRLSRLLPYPVLWKAGLTLFPISIWGFLKWRTFHFDWSYLPALVACGAFVLIIMSLHARKKFSDLKWWQSLIILLTIFLSVPAIILILEYFTT